MLLSGAIGCFHPKAPSSNMDAYSTIAGRLESCQPWATLDPSDVKSAACIMDTMLAIRQHDYNFLRQLLSRYISDKKSKGSYNVECASKLFVLNRVLFQVPEEESIDVPHFGGWNIPHDATNANRLWPLAMKNGQLVLVGEFQGYFGSKYDALGEFDFFWKKYGPRR